MAARIDVQRTMGGCVSDTSVRPICGVVMPISSIDGCNEAHWADVLEILTESIEQAGFEANMVSNADDVGIIHKRIIQNLYDNPIVVCDVSGKNPNVMFELGLRLAFDKPTIIVKDDKTSYSFDTSAIEHLEYPRDLRFSKIVEFREKLSAKLRATHQKAKEDKNYTTFLKHFGEFTVAKLEKKEVSGQEYILEELQGIRFAIRRLERTSSVSEKEFFNLKKYRGQNADVDVCLGSASADELKKAFEVALNHPDLRDVGVIAHGNAHHHLIASIAPGSLLTEAEVKKIFRGKNHLELLLKAKEEKT